MGESFSNEPCPKCRSREQLERAKGISDEQLRETLDYYGRVGGVAAREEKMAQITNMRERVASAGGATGGEITLRAGTGTRAATGVGEAVANALEYRDAVSRAGGTPKRLRYNAATQQMDMGSDEGGWLPLPSAGLEAALEMTQVRAVPQTEPPAQHPAERPRRKFKKDQW
jgi:hypothetical protein